MATQLDLLRERGDQKSVKGKDLLFEALRIHKKGSISNMSGGPTTAKHKVAQKVQAMKEGRITIREKKVPLNHLMKEDQLKLLFKMLKEQYLKEEHA